MSIKCEKCGVENENGAKFCKSCGTSLNVEPTQTVNAVANNSTLQTVKKVAMWISGAVGVIIALIIIVNFINDKNQDSRIRELRNGCANNDAQACYELGIFDDNHGLFTSEENIGYEEIHEALAKGCQLGNKDACREGKYYERGCELQDGESCYLYANDIIKSHGLEGQAACIGNPSSYLCKIAKNFDQNDAAQYYKRACDNGYSQGCL